MLSIPIENQYEQELNARYLKELGYGSWTRKISASAISEFLEHTSELEKSLSAYERRDNRIVLSCLDELIARVAAGKKRPKRLETKALGSFGD
jgi:UDP:flavonoid glycosyltransferase YjiC (YdhE family)